MRRLWIRLVVWWNLRGLLRKGLMERQGNTYRITPLGEALLELEGLPELKPEDFRQ